MGRLSRRAIAKLVGVAPLSCESGAGRGQRFIHGGLAPVSTALYMAALVGARRNPVVREFYARLVAKGKPKQVALTACARKLLTIVNTIVRTGTPWQEPAAPAATA